MKHKYLKDVTTLSYDVEKCIGCGICTQVCPHKVFIINDKKAKIIHRDSCIECGACALNCPVKALTVNPGTGCAAAFIIGWLTGTEPTCDPNGNSSGCC